MPTTTSGTNGAAPPRGARTEASWRRLPFSEKEKESENERGLPCSRGTGREKESGGLVVFSADDFFFLSRKREEKEKAINVYERTGRPFERKKGLLLNLQPHNLHFLLFLSTPLGKVSRSLWPLSIAFRPRTVLHGKAFRLSGPAVNGERAYLFDCSRRELRDPQLPLHPSLVAVAISLDCDLFSRLIPCLLPSS